MSVPDHADFVKTPRPDADAMDTGGSLSHLSHLSHVPRQPHERVPPCAPHRRPSCSACSLRWRSSRCRWSAPRTRPRTRCTPRSARRPCTASSSPPSGPGRCGAAPGRRSRRSRRPGSRRRRAAASGGRTCWSPAPTSRPSTCSASPGDRGDRPGRPHRPGAHPRPQGLDRLDRAGRHRHAGRQRGQGGPPRHRAALGRRLGRLPGPGRRASAAPCRAACGSTWWTRAARPPTASVGAGRPMQSAQAAVAQPQIFTRAQWGADESIRGSAPKYNATIKAGFVHHTAGTNGYSAADVPEDPARHLRLPRQGQRLVGHRLQLPRRPVRPALGGPVRRHHPSRRRRPHRRLQRRQLRACRRSATTTRSPRPR